MEHLPQQHAVRVDVALVVVLLVADDLRCHVAVGPRLGGVVRSEAGGDAEVGELDVHVLVEQHVGRLVRLRVRVWVVRVRIRLRVRVGVGVRA